MQAIRYEQDIIAWANQQAQWIRSGNFTLLDLKHLADEIEDVGKSEQRELANRMAILLAHLLKWQFQMERRGASWEVTIRNQRMGIVRRLQRTPSLKSMLSDVEWQEEIWADAVAHASEVTGLSHFPQTCPWTTQEILNQAWLPGEIVSTTPP
ncbi:conserved hypothetical protein [Gammaproteobacteria bacterium]